MCNNPNTRFLLRVIIDVLIIIGIGCVALIALPQALETTQRGFFCNDYTLKYAYTKPLLSKVHMAILVVALPAACILIVELLRTAFVTRSGRSEREPEPQRFAFVGIRVPTFISECYQVKGVYIFGLGLQLIAALLAKRLVGRLRPYFFDVCQPQLLDGTSCADADNRLRYIVDYNCTELVNSAALLDSVRHAFPSGYAATAAYAMCFLACYLQVRLTAVWLRLLRITLQFACLALAALVAVERIVTFRNHWTDVLGGLVLGVSVALFAAITVLKFFRCTHVKRRRLRPSTPQIYGYYGIGRNYTPNYY